jgi:sulfur-oxidizing protein SoxX
MKNATENKMSSFTRCLSVALFALFAGTLVLKADAAELDGKKLAFDRSKGNCLTCHAMKGGDSAGTIGPELSDMKARFPDRKELIAIIGDETTRNPQTMMPPFKRNLILTDKEIAAIADYLLTL